MANVESTGNSSLLMFVQRLGAVPFAISLILGIQGARGASALFLLGGVVLNPLLSYIHVGARDDGLNIQWLWLEHRIPWASIRSVEYKAELIGGRLSVTLWNSDALRVSSLVPLGWVEDQVKQRIDGTPSPPSDSVALPWWMTRLRPGRAAPHDL
jgi:hypothetical protein